MEKYNLVSSDVMLKEFPKKIELHCHLDGSIRHSTIWEILREKGVPLPGNGTYKDLVNALVITKPKDLNHFLSPYELFIKTYQADMKVIERVAYEYCEDAYKNGIVYAEVRYSPHKSSGEQFYHQFGMKALEEVVEATNRGLQRGCAKFGINVKTILIIFHGWSESNNINVAEDVLKLCLKYRDDVVGLDVCSRQPPGGGNEEAPVLPHLTSVFEEAHRTGVKTTIHAGESSGSSAIKRARYHYLSDRVGHGYHVVQDEKLYTQCLKDNVHFECCPYSSHLTGAVPFTVKKHPIARFAEDNANFSLSTDDTTLTGKTINDDYALVKEFGLTNGQIRQANINAARECFLPEFEKNKLIKEIEKAYGYEDLNNN